MMMIKAPPLTLFFPTHSCDFSSHDKSKGPGCCLMTLYVLTSEPLLPSFIKSLFLDHEQL